MRLGDALLALAARFQARLANAKRLQTSFAKDLTAFAGFLSAYSGQIFIIIFSVVVSDRVDLRQARFQTDLVAEVTTGQQSLPLRLSSVAQSTLWLLVLFY